MKIGRLGVSLCAAAVLTSLISVPASAESPGQAYDWYLSPRSDHTQPEGTKEADFLAGCDAYYVGSAEKKVIYLTFDTGYVNHYTLSILDTLKQEETPATFFILKHVLDANPDVVRRMAEEGHAVGNHTCTHPDITKFATLEQCRGQVEPMETLYAQVTGKQMSKIFRPPQGRFSKTSLQMIQQCGYRTIFWSLAHYDWDEKKQPDPEKAFQLLNKRIHPGAVVLLHSNSATNAQILSRLIRQWKSDGYEFRTLDQFEA